MAGRTRSHSDARWELLPPTVIRCNATRPNGARCRREAEDGAVVCDQHGGAAPQVRRRAAERLIMTADRAAENLVRMMEDGEVPFGVRAKIASVLMIADQMPHWKAVSAASLLARSNDSAGHLGRRRSDAKFTPSVRTHA